MEQWTVGLMFGTALLAFCGTVAVAVVAVWHVGRRVVRTVDRLEQVVAVELVNGGDTEADGYKGFREEVMDRFAEGGDWMRLHERLPSDLAHGQRRDPPR